MMKYFMSTDAFNPSTMFFDKRSRMSNNGNNNGKLSIVINAVGLLAREAIALTIVSIEANPILPTTKQHKNSGTFATKLPMNNE